MKNSLIIGTRRAGNQLSSSDLCQTSTPDPKLRDALAALCKKIDDGWINGDAASLAALYTEDAVIVSHEAAPIYGRDAIEKRFVDLFKHLHFSKHMSQQEQYSPHVMSLSMSYGAQANLIRLFKSKTAVLFE